jgi:prepilin-type N-terminal cleavage/methylation domain-containing protein
MLTVQALRNQAKGLDGSEAGFSLLEMMFTVLVMSIVLVVAGSALVSLSRTASRNEAMVETEQSASTVMAQLTRDIRSAGSLSVPSGATPADEVELAVVKQSGGTTTVLWTYNTAAATLTREVEVGSTFEPSGFTVSKVANPSSSAVFTYYDDTGSNISATSTSNIATCTTAIGVDLYVASTTSGVANQQESNEVALTNQLNALDAPGSGQC